MIKNRWKFDKKISKYFKTKHFDIIKGTQEMTVKKDKQPVISTEVKLMRLKNDIAMRGVIRKQKGKEQALIDRQRRFSRQLSPKFLSSRFILFWI